MRYEKNLFLIFLGDLFMSSSLNAQVVPNEKINERKLENATKIILQLQKELGD